MSSSSSARATQRTKKTKAATKSIGSVPKKAPRYLSAFLDFVASQYDEKTEEISRRKVLACDRKLVSFFAQHWTDFVEYVERTRPRKRQRTEQTYTESKLSKDSKSIVNKLETMKLHIQQLNQADIKDDIAEMHGLSQDIYDAVHETIPAHSSSEVLPTSSQAEPTSSILTSFRGHGENTDMQIATEPAPSILDPTVVATPIVATPITAMPSSS